MTTLGVGFGEARAQQYAAVDALDDIGGSLAHAGASCDWSHPVLAGIGASYAALASPLAVLRQYGLPAFRTTCGDVQGWPGSSDAGASVVVAVSQSGRSRETVELAERCTAAGIPVVAITNRKVSPLAEVSSHVICLGEFADSRVSTVGFITTFAVLGELVDLITTNRVDPGWSGIGQLAQDTVVRLADRLAEFAANHLGTGAVDVVASSSQLTAAEALALLLREGPYVPASGYDTRSYLHGPMDCAGHGVTHVLFGNEREAQLATQLGERTDSVLLVSDQVAADALTVPTGLTSTQRALIEVCIGQELTAAVAAVRHESIDEAVFVRQDTKLNA